MTPDDVADFGPPFWYVAVVFWLTSTVSPGETGLPFTLKVTVSLGEDCADINCEGGTDSQPFGGSQVAPIDRRLDMLEEYEIKINGCNANTR